MIDVTHEISSIRRNIGSRTLESGEARVLTVTRVYPAAADELWDVCTNPERIPRWFMPVSGDLTVGGRFELEGNASGTIQSCDPPKSFTSTWEFGGQVSWIEVRLVAENAEHTRFELEHVAHVDETMWAEYGPGAVGIGWDGALMGLGLHVATGAANDPEEFMRWATSEEGRGFYAGSSEAWAEASIAAGSPTDEARAAAERATAFYTTAPE